MPDCSRQLFSAIWLVIAVASADRPVHAQTVWRRSAPASVSEARSFEEPRWTTWLRTGPGKAAAVRGATDIVPPRDASLTRLSRYDGLIEQQQAVYGIPQALVRAVIRTESDFDPNVVSSVGAQGLMQLMPHTARQLGVADPFDPAQNIMGGAHYLQLLARRFCVEPIAGDTAFVSFGSLRCSRVGLVNVVAGYHAGPGAVQKYGGLPPYETTRAYVTSVIRRFDEYAGSGS